MYQTLYHGTPSSKFYDIIRLGKIDVSANTESTYTEDVLYTNKTMFLSNSTSGKEYTIAQILDHEEKGLYKIDIQLQEHMDTLHDEIEQRIIETSDLSRRQLVKERWKTYSQTILKIDLSEGNPSDHIVYLANKERAKAYARCFLLKSSGLEFNEYHRNSNLNFGVLLELVVEEENLAPDLNDGRPVDFFRPEWLQTYEDNGQCVHNGAISVSSIKTVTFIVPESMNPLAYRGMQINFNTPYPYKEAVEIIHQWKKQSDQMVENIRFREEILKANKPL